MKAEMNASGTVARRLSVVLPVHNEEGNIAPLVARLYDLLAGAIPWFELIVVNDGSTDQSVASLLPLEARKMVRIVHHNCNLGYGATLRSGFNAARGDYIAFIDGDGQLEPEDLLGLLPHVSARQLALGYRAKRKDPILRVLLGNVFSRVFVPLTLGVRVRDVDCALKIVPRMLIDAVDLRADGALINAELLAHATAMGYVFHQAPVRHYPRKQGEQSGAKLSVVARVFTELFAVKRRISEQHREQHREECRLSIANSVAS